MIAHGDDPAVPIARVRVDDVEYPVVVPHHETDYIQSNLMKSGEPYELTMLRAMSTEVSPGDLALDIGANIGNHSLFLAHRSGCRVIAFEPNRDLAEALEQSALIGQVADRVQVHACAAGSTSHRGRLQNLDDSNLGGQTVVVDDAGGGFDIVVLDDLDFGDRIALMKVDVEGMELDVLKGASALVARDRPVLFVEAMTASDFEAVAAWMAERDYCYEATFNATPTHQFRPGVAAERRLNRRLLETVRETYALREAALSAKKAADAASLKYRHTTEAQQDEHALYAERIDALQAQITQMQGSHKRRIQNLKAKQAAKRRTLVDELARTRRELSALQSSRAVRYSRSVRGIKESLRRASRVSPSRGRTSSKTPEVAPPHASSSSTGNSVLLVTNHYPSEQDQYRNKFVHRRVIAYRAGGVDVDIFRTQGKVPTSHHFEGVDVDSGPLEELRSRLETGGYEVVLVHFLSPALWQILRDFSDDLRIVVWVHGFEIQPWWRRRFNYLTEEDLAAAKQVSEDRLRFWRGIIDRLPDRMTLVFVSRSFADDVSEDLERELPPARMRIIHNPIDTDLFSYQPKPPEQRMRVLSIRPYTTPTYANDLSVAAVLELSTEAWFGDLEFSFVGDGPLFDQTLAPLREFANVHIRQGFLTAEEIASLHKDYGVFLAPSRTDSHGVSRDEAMSSGLVPIVSAVAAVPEFVSEAEGYLADPDDHHGLAWAIAALHDDPEVFQQKSQAAAARVRRQATASLVIPAEIALITGTEHAATTGPPE